MPIRQELLDELLKGYEKTDDLLGDDGLLQQLTKALVERALEAEIRHHLGYKKHAAVGASGGQFEKRKFIENDQKQTRTNLA